MPVTLYHAPLSPPSRGTLLSAHAAGVKVDIRTIDLFAKEHLKTDFVKINPQHTIPTLDDNGYILWESAAIASYLVGKYGKTDSLYPKDPQKKSIVDRCLCFDVATLFPRLKAVAAPIFFFGSKTVPEDARARLLEAFGFLNMFLEGQKWVAGNHLTIADCACVATTSSAIAMGLDLSRFPNVTSWVKRCEEEIPGYKDNQDGADIFGNTIKSLLPQGYNVNK